MGLCSPPDAVLDSGTEQVVFVAQGNGMFGARKVKIGRRLGDVIVNPRRHQGGQGDRGRRDVLPRIRTASFAGRFEAYQAPGPPTPTPTPNSAPAAQSDVDIAFRGVTDPLRTGANQFEAIVMDAGGKPVDDADVTLQLFMPAIPTMNMPAMRSEARLAT
jgi:hypothetical protein